MKKSNLINLINKHSYEYVGRVYGVTGNFIKKISKKLGILLTPRRKINNSEHFNRGKNFKKSCCSNVSNSKEKRQARLHNNIIIKKYKNLGIPLISPGCCHICGQLNCNCDFCKNHNFLQLIGLTRFGLNPKTIGTTNIFSEFNRIKEIIYDLYWNKNYSLSDIGKYFNYQGNKNCLHISIFRHLDIPTRNISEAETLYLSTHSKNISTVIPKNNFYHSQWHTTWNEKQVFLRSSYELDYAKQLDNKKIIYCVESLLIFYFDTFRNMIRIAIPDFYLPDKNEIVEIKSDYTLDIQQMRDKFKKYRELGYTATLVLEHTIVNLDNIEQILSKKRLERINKFTQERRKLISINK